MNQRLKRPTHPWNRLTHVTGDLGQRFEVRYKDGAGTERVFGWAGEQKSVDVMLKSIRLHPVWHSPRVIDRGAKSA